jgi:cbb3-type cytochrome oxidase maturation protein
MSFLFVTVPVSLLLAVTLLGVVIWAVRTGAFDDWHAPAERHAFDDDSVPERSAPGAARSEDAP